MLGKEVFNDQLMQFETEDIREFTAFCLESVPQYIYDVPASSSGKHHSEVDCLEHGLVYHIKNSFSILNYILELEKANPIFKFDIRMRDMMRCAMLLHDSLKQGTQEEYDNTEEHHTKFTHPLDAAKFVLSFRDCSIISRKEIMKISELIASHMGMWNTSTHEDGRLPVPHNAESQFIHIADYLGSREDIIIKRPGDYTVTVN